MSQDRKEWIKTRMAILRKQAGFSFNQDLFISILLCLMSERDKHLVLTAPPERLTEVSHMATLISRHLFGFTVAKTVCREKLTKSDIVEALFNSKEEAEDKQPKNEASVFSHQPSRSIQTIDSEKSYYSHKLLENENVIYTSPISPVDFNLRKRERIFKKNRWSEQERLYVPSINSNRIAQILVMQNLELCDATTQAFLLELMITKELRISNVKYNMPKPFFLVIAVLPQGYNRLSISSQLMDRFFVSYNFEQDMFLSSNNTLLRQPSSRRFALVKQEEIKALADKASKVHVNIDITRYIRDIVVGIRTHPRIKGGLTARCSKDLVAVTKSLATLFERDFLTPDLVTIAAEKVFGHRLHVLAVNSRDDQMEKEDMDCNIPSDVIAEILRVIYVPV
ncbi:uncharacterized protein B0P05DRAFT_563210 [Gilbertella persicaria]|nr:uncharacterized protein B0P05DRAFT_563210 [Gilbertella persicaria]KAI8050133.1 hypothetical protein B0P05DRAFT_563210 [Gilbertella persicaria]